VLRTGVRYEAIVPEGVLVVGAVGRELIAADSVVVAAGQVPHDPVSGALVSRGLPSVVVGGARDTVGLNAVRAFDEGLLAASELLSR
jgi:2,4-dienoyl-CoA reductase (NADPH2)